jgi:hypothetical protein
MLISAGIGGSTSITVEPVGYILAIVALIILLCMAEILLASKYWSERVSSTINTAILPLLLVFCAIVLLKILQVLR